MPHELQLLFVTAVALFAATFRPASVLIDILYDQCCARSQELAQGSGHKDKNKLVHAESSELECEITFTVPEN